MIIILMYKLFLFYKPKGRRVERFGEAESNPFVVFMQLISL